MLPLSAARRNEMMSCPALNERSTLTEEPMAWARISKTYDYGSRATNQELQGMFLHLRQPEGRMLRSASTIAAGHLVDESGQHLDSAAVHP